MASKHKTINNNPQSKGDAREAKARTDIEIALAAQGSCDMTNSRISGKWFEYQNRIQFGDIICQ